MKKNTFLKFGTIVLFQALKVTTATVDALVKYDMKTIIPPSIATPGSFETSLSMLRLL